MRRILVTCTLVMALCFSAGRQAQAKTDDGFRQRIARDVVTVNLLRDNLGKAVAFARSRPEIFSSPPSVTSIRKGIEP